MVWHSSLASIKPWTPWFDLLVLQAYILKAYIPFVWPSSFTRDCEGDKKRKQVILLLLGYVESLEWN